jgi:hypothetical protein
LFQSTNPALLPPTDNAMTLDQANQTIKACASQMNALYHQVVFDEWAIVRFAQRKGQLLSYTGPRKEDFQKNFVGDLNELRVGLLGNTHGVGDFEFARHGVGTKVEAFLIVGQGIYLLCNHTARSMDDITKNPLWLSAQKAFVELSDQFRSSPLNV